MTRSIEDYWTMGEKKTPKEIEPMDEEEILKTDEEEITGFSMER